MSKIIRTLSEQLAQAIVEAIATSSLTNSIEKYNGDFEKVAKDFGIPVGHLRIALAYLFRDMFGLDIEEVVNEEFEQENNNNSGTRELTN